MIDAGAEARAARRRGEHRPQPLPVSEPTPKQAAAAEGGPVEGVRGCRSDA